MNLLSKTFICTTLIGLGAFFTFAHEGNVHSRDIGIVFGLCDLNGKKRNLLTQDLYKNIGREISLLIDGDTEKKETSELQQKLNDIVRDELKKENTLPFLLNSARRRNKKFLMELDKNLKYLKKQNSYKGISYAAEHLNRISSSMNDLPFYAGTDIGLISNIIYTKRNEFWKGRELLKMRKFLFDMNNRIKDILLPNHSIFQQQTIKERIDIFAQKEKFFKLGGYGHRLFFHWGYNVNFVNSYPPLQLRISITKDSIRKDFPENKDRVELIANRLYDEIKKKWQDKKYTAKVKLKKNLKNDEIADTILQIAYNIHILGDYSGNIIEPLAPIRVIQTELINAIKKIDVNNTKKRKVIERINAAAKKHMNYDKKNAEAILNVLKYEIPRLIDASPTYKKLLWGEEE